MRNVLSAETQLGPLNILYFFWWWESPDLVRVCIALERHYNHSNSYKGKHLTGVAHLQFRNSVMAREHGNWDYGGVQSNMVLERYLRILCHARDRK